MEENKEKNDESKEKPDDNEENKETPPKPNANATQVLCIGFVVFKLTLLVEALVSLCGERGGR